MCEDYFVMIPTEEYDRLIEWRDYLLCLEAAGVSSWEGYDTAVGEVVEPEPLPPTPNPIRDAINKAVDKVLWFFIRIQL